jgi:ATP-dependent DNA helicase RecG
MISDKSARDIIAELNVTDETEHIEAKTMGEATVGRSLYETICSMSNEPDLGGGTILLGVAKEENSLFPLYTATGVKDPDKLSSDIVTSCASMFNTPIRPAIKTEMADGQILIRIDVAELQPHLKPLYFTSVGTPRGAYRRIGASDVRCTEEDIIMLYRGKQSSTYDSHIIEDAHIDDIDPAAVKAYRDARRESHAGAVELGWSDDELLYSVGAIRKVDEKPRITATGVLMFGRSSALRRLFPTQRVDYIRVQGREWVRDPENRFEPIDMRGPIVTLVSRVIAAISDDLPKAFRIDDTGLGQRQDIPIIPLQVIREAVVNALMHRSYQVHQPVQIVRYSNRLVIKNPGYSLKSQERFDEPGSQNRNPLLAEILHDTRFAENKGSGIRAMRQMLVNSGLSLPTFDSDRDNDVFTAIFLFHHFLNEDDWKWLKHFQKFDLNEDQMRALVYVREVQAIDNFTYRSFTQTDTLAASNSLRKLKSLDLLTAKGGGSKVYYVMGPSMLAALDAHGAAATLQPSLEDKRSNLEGNEPSIAITDLPMALRKAVNMLALRGRMKPFEAQDIIYKICRWRALSASEIASLLGKSTKHTTDAYLYPMIKDGVLSYTYPDMVNHPQQKYLAAKEPAKPEGQG